MAGSSGAIGSYDVTTGNLENYSAPVDVTNNCNDVAVTGEAGEVNVYVAGDSDGPDDVWTSGGGGMIFYWDGVEWRPADTGDAGLRDLEVADGEGLTVGGGGKVYD